MIQAYASDQKWPLARLWRARAEGTQRLIDRVLRQIARGAATAPAGVSSPTRSPR